MFYTTANRIRSCWTECLVNNNNCLDRGAKNSTCPKLNTLPTITSSDQIIPELHVHSKASHWWEVVAIYKDVSVLRAFFFLISFCVIQQNLTKRTRLFKILFQTWEDVNGNTSTFAKSLQKRCLFSMHFEWFQHFQGPAFNFKKMFPASVISSMPAINWPLQKLQMM